MSDLDFRLERARIQMGGVETADQDAVRRELEAIENDFPLSHQGREAARLLRSLSTTRARILEDGEELRQLERLWREIDCSSHPELVDASQRLFDLTLIEGPRLRNLRTAAIEFLRAAVRTETQVEVLDWVGEAMTAVAGHPDYRALISEGIADARSEVFRRRFTETLPAIEAGIAAWDLEAARAALDGLGDAPEDLADTVAAIYRRITEALDHRSRMRRMLEELSDVRVQSMADIESFTARIDRLESLSARVSPPEPWRRDVELATVRLTEQIETWVNEKARRISETSGMGAVYQELRRLPARWQPSERSAWFSSVWTALLDNARSTLANIRRREAVADVANGFIELQGRLPESLAGKASAVSRALLGIAEVWRMAVEGERVSLPDLAPLGGPVELPSPFLECLAAVEALHRRLDGLQQRIDDAGANRSETEAEAALAELQALATRRGAPRRVKQLIERIETLRRGWLCRRALDRWDVPAVMKAMREGGPVLDPNGLDNLERFLRKAEELAKAQTERDIDRQLAWWDNWEKKLCPTLPASCYWPSGLPEVLRDVERARVRRLTGEVTSALTATKTDVDAWSRWVVSLGKLEEYPPLRALKEKIQRQILTTRFSEAEKAGDWSAADAILTELIALGLSSDRIFTCRLRRELAEAEATGALLTLLPVRWQDVRRRMPERMAPLLLSALRIGAGDQERHPAGEHLLPCISEAMAALGTETRDARLLRLWRDWFPVMRQLEQEPAEIDFVTSTPFFQHLSDDEWRELASALGGLIASWRARDHWLALAWARRLFRGAIVAGLSDDYENRLRAEAEGRVKSLLERIEGMAAISRATVAEPFRQMAGEVKQWESFERVLGITGGRPPVRPKILDQTKALFDQVRRLAEDIDALEQGDFRAPHTRAVIEQALAVCGRLPEALPSRGTAEARLYQLLDACRLRGDWEDFQEICRALENDRYPPEDTNRRLLVVTGTISRRLADGGIAGGPGASQLAGDALAALCQANPGLALPPVVNNFGIVQDIVQKLVDEDDAASETIRMIERMMPSGDISDPEDTRLQPFFTVFPSKPPVGMIATRRLNAIIRRDPMPSIIRAAGYKLPVWVRGEQSKH